MTARSRVMATMVAAGVALTGMVFAQGGAPAPQTPTTAPADPAGGRGGGPGQAGPAQGRGQVGGPRRGGFPQFTRPLPTQEVILRGKGLYDTNCASCHAPDLRGVPPKGTNILRSGSVFRDDNGEVLGPVLKSHKPTFNFLEPDVVAMAAFLHSNQALMGGQGSPQRGGPPPELNILVGNAAAGEKKFATYCSKCHSATGDMRGIATRLVDPRALQNAWVAGASGRFGGGGRGGAIGVGSPATVTMANGQKLEGTLVRVDDFLVVITLPDGTRRSMARTNGVPRVDVTDPQKAHKDMVLAIDDATNANMHDITAYLWTLK